MTTPATITAAAASPTTTKMRATAAPTKKRLTNWSELTVLLQFVATGWLVASAVSSGHANDQAIHQSITQSINQSINLSISTLRSNQVGKIIKAAETSSDSPLGQVHWLDIGLIIYWKAVGLGFSEFVAWLRHNWHLGSLNYDYIKSQQLCTWMIYAAA